MNHTPNSVSSDIRKISGITGASISAMPFIAPGIVFRKTQKAPRLRPPAAARTPKSTPGPSTGKATPTTTASHNQSKTAPMDLVDSAGIQTLCDTFGEIWGPPERSAGALRWPAADDRPCIVITNSVNESSKYDAQTLVINTPMSTDQSIAHIASIIRSLSSQPWALAALCVMPAQPTQSRRMLIRGHNDSWSLSTSLTAGCTRGEIRHSRKKEM